MEEKDEKMFEGVRGYIRFIFKLIISFMNMFFSLLLLAGACVSFILLLKLFPDTAMKFYYTVFPFLNIIWNVIIFLIEILIGLVLGYLIIRFIFAMIGFNKEQKEKKAMKRELLIECIIDKINKRDKNVKKK